MPAERSAAIGLGCSLGNREAQLRRTVRALASSAGIELHAVSRWYRTPPMHGGTATGWFLNGVVRVMTAHEPAFLLALCRTLEDRAGRRRAKFWGDRTLDLDLLLVGDAIVESDTLSLPHPAIAARPFVRTPLLEVWPDAVDPRSGQPYRELPGPVGPRAVPVGIVAHTRGFL